MKQGDLVTCAPFELEYNPERGSSPFIGLYMGRRPSPTGSNISQHGILGPNGMIWLWCNRWVVEIVHETG